VNTLGTGTGGSFVLTIQGAHGAVVEGNRISNATRDPGGSWGIWVASAPDVLVLFNSISNTAHGVAYQNGATGTYSDNRTSSVDTPYSGGTDAGNNH
jgi:nitrous oxidase accessory protein NosD